MHKLLIAVVLATLTGAPAVASDEADVLATVHRWTEAFNHASFATDIAPCTEDAVVIDDLQPHVWQAPRACSRWYEAVKAWTVKAAVTKPAIAIGKPRHLDFEAGYAYLVAPVTLSYIKAAKSVDFRGIITMTLHRGESGWLVSGVAWADE